MGLIPTAFPAKLFHISVGIFFTFLGFVHDAEIVRQVVGGMGILLVICKGIIMFMPLMWGASPLHGPIEITCLVAGVLSIFAAKYLRSGTEAGGG